MERSALTVRLDQLEEVEETVKQKLYPPTQMVNAVA